MMKATLALLLAAGLLGAPVRAQTSINSTIPGDVAPRGASIKLLGAQGVFVDQRNAT